jgi:SAM-dependent methyltransferase
VVSTRRFLLKDASNIDNRTRAELEKHYLIEKELAERLRNAGKEARKELYASLYAELFEKIPYFDQIKSDRESRAAKVKNQVKFLSRFIAPGKIFMELGAGDCALSLALCRHFRKVYAVDVSPQISPNEQIPPNFTFVLTDGTKIGLPTESVDIAFSNQLMEHLHPDDAYEQLQDVYKTLGKDGIYIIITPHRYSGPHDISKHFDRVATGFHLKEYRNKELAALLRRVGFSGIGNYVKIAGRFLKVPLFVVIVFEGILTPLPYVLRKRAFGLFPFKHLLRIRMTARK